MSTALAAVGLALNTAGAAIAFFVGFPQPEYRGSALLLSSSPPAEELERARARRRRWSYAGPALMVVGFALQFAALFL